MLSLQVVSGCVSEAKLSQPVCRHSRPARAPVEALCALQPVLLVARQCAVPQVAAWARVPGKLLQAPAARERSVHGLGRRRSRSTRAVERQGEGAYTRHTP